MKEQRTIELLRRGHSRALGSLVVTGSALLLSSVLLIIFLSMMMRSEWIDDGIVKAKMIASNSNAAVLFGDEKAAQEILSSLDMAPSVESAALFVANGSILAQYRRTGEHEAASPAHGQWVGHRFEWQHFVVIEEIRNGDERIGLVSLRFMMKPFYQRLLGHVAVIMAVALGALLIVYLFTSRMRMAVSRAEIQLDFLAYTDPVTSLPNRRAFNMELESMVASAKNSGGQVGLILLDLDNFKVVNDTMGHQCGDEILRMVANRLTSTLRSVDLVCRMGGDEFVLILMPDEDAEIDLDTIAARVLELLSEPFRYQEHEFFLTASVGGSMFPADAQDSETLIRKADAAMYSAKQEGKNTFAAFRPEMDKVAQRRLAIEINLRRALERGELALHYQPQINLADGQVAGIEALLRWHHHELGAISPAEFIPVAEESGLIIDIGKWALQTACQQMVVWCNAGIAPPRVAVNLSTRQVKDASLALDIHAILSQTGLSAQQLELEITEGILMENVHANIRFLQQLRLAGVSLSVDDFGTGYSSLSYLKRFPVNQLKIDRSFVRDLPGEGEAFIVAIISMAHSLGLTVVAEGVETAEQLRFLRDNGCDIVQGYYFARPAAADDVTELLRSRRLTGLLA
ncbi:MAG: putative signal transduction eal-ggdef domain transrane protein [Burkholderiaceae bacterium]|nr:putative signal transduction eal-ggdef domain transrane protein [Burkholderiaceae bacterium]